jgi:CRISPR-associated endonuclease/helicase Cas3
MTTLPFTYHDAWAKTAAGGQIAMQLKTHCLITGSVGQALALRDEIPILAACHDVGKLSAPFLAQSELWMAEHGLSDVTERWRRSKIRHEIFTQSTITEILEFRSLPLSAALILGAHHGRWQMEDLGELDLKEWRAFFKAQRHALVMLLEAEFGQLPEECFSNIQSRYLAGAVSVCDWIASNPEFFPYHDDYPVELRDRLASEAIARIGLIPAPLMPGLTFEQAFGFPPNAMQLAISGLPLDRGLYLIEADTGSGKTEAALHLAYRLMAAGAARGLYFALPTQLASNLILRRVQKALRKFSSPAGFVRLCHGNAWLEQRRYRPMEGSDDALAWFSSARRGLLAPYGAGTIDQALMSTLKSVKHSAVRTFGIAGKAVIVDEAHSYDAYTGTLLEKLAAQCRELKSPLIVLSATLPSATKQRLCSIFNDSTLCLNFSNSDAPQKHVQLAWTDEAAVSGLAINVARTGQCVMIVRNTVRLAQETFRGLQDCGVPAGLVHSRFTQRHRRAHERYWTKALGKKGRRPEGCILVGTQILEQSLDIDADVLITDLCPIDLFIQRLGRLWRHYRPQRIGTPIVHVINPEPDFGASGKVYSPYLLARSLETLRQHDQLSLPAQTRELIEAVYVEREETDPELQRLQAELAAQITTAIHRAERAADDRVDYDDEDATLTRLIDQKTTEVVIHSGSEVIPGGLRLWFGGRSVAVLRDESSPGVGRQLHLNSVKVPFYLIVAEPFEPKLSRYFPGGVKLALLTDGRLEFLNSPGFFTYTSQTGFEYALI